MKKILKVILILVVIMAITGCNSRDDVEHLSQDGLIKYVENNITEEVQFVEVNIQDVDNYIYTFKLIDRDINFEVYDSIRNYGLSIDGSQIYDHYKRSISFNDYVVSIMENLEHDRLNILNKFNFEEKYYDYGAHVITIEDYTDLSNLCKYIVELDSLYMFNIKSVKKIGLTNDVLADVISFSKTDSSIEGIAYSTNKNARLTYNIVFNQLEEQYVKQLKKFNLTDDTIPNDIWDKY